MFEPNAIIAVVALVAAIGGLAMCVLRLAKQSADIKSLKDQIKRLDTQVQTAVSGSVGMGRRIVQLEKRLKELADNQENRTGNTDEFAYGQALQMFDQGADVETVASSCGFSNSEAQLMALVQKHLNKQGQPESIDEK